MRSRGTGTLVVIMLAGTIGAAAAQDATKLTARYAAITSEFLQAVRSNRNQLPKAVQQRRDALAELVKDAESQDAEKFTYDDHLTLAKAYAVLKRHADVVKHGNAAIVIKPDADEPYGLLVSSLLTEGKLKEAEQKYAAALKRFPNSDRLKGLHYSFYTTLREAKEWSAAAEHLSHHVDWQRERLLASGGNPNQIRSYQQSLAMLAGAFASANEGEKALAELERQIQAISEATGDDKSESIENLLSELRASKIELMARAGQSKQALELMESELEQARAALAKATDDIVAILNVATLLQTKADLAAKAGEDKQANENRSAWLAFLSEQLTQHPGSDDLLVALVQGYQTAIIRLMGSGRSVEAAELLKTAKERFAELSPSGATARSALGSGTEMLSRLESRLEAELVRAELIGQPAFPLVAEAWVNGSPVSEDDLKGKVVLLDFWAVWCGPCIATFPHLREWNEKYEPKGLVMIGVTRNYGYGWNEETQRAERVEDISPEEEQVALEKFLEHHDLTHHVAVMPSDGLFTNQYGVTGIPQVVVIDRAGKIRLIRVGSGEPNAIAIEEMLETLLAEPAGS